MILEIKKELQKVVDSERIYDVSKFFKTGKEELLNIKGMGVKTLEKIETIIKEAIAA